MNGPRASVLVPTHDHATTLPLTVASVLGQSVADLEVLVIGDGVTAETRRAAEELVAGDERVRFLDLPKGPHHGEVHRHTAVVAARSDAIFYLCDDDLLMPEHVADLLLLLEDADLVQSRNGYFGPNGEVGLYPTDLSDRRCLDWHLRGPVPRNATSITGTAHSRSYYLEVGEPWETTPPGAWPDHHQWSKFFRRPDFRGATSHRMTALQLPTSMSGRDTWTPQMRYDELARWAAMIAEPGAQERIDALVDRTTQVVLARTRAERDALADRVAALEAREELLTVRVRRLRERLASRKRAVARLRRRSAAAEDEIARLRASRSWRLTAPLRAARGRWRRRAR